MELDSAAESRSTPPDWDEPPPLFGAWKRVYITIVLYVVALILVLYWVTVSLNH